MPDAATLARDVTAWAAARTAHAVRIDWPFTTADARIQLKRLYPVITEITKTTLP